jgi:plastocyanin
MSYILEITAMPRRLSPAVSRVAALLTAATLAGCGGYNAPTGNNNQNQPPPTEQTGDINIVVGASTKTTAAFSPNPKTVSLAGAASVNVRFVNRDISGGDYTQGTAEVHRIVSDNGTPSSFDTNDLGGNGQRSVTLSATGTYTYHCTHHPNMVGTIQVTP